MAVVNGRIPTTQLGAIPAAFHTHGTTAYMSPPAADAFLRLAAAFQTRFGKRLTAMSFYRPMSDQVRIFLKNYYKVNRHRSLWSDRTYQGSTYAKRDGMSAVASPGWSNHGLGLAVDLQSGVNRAGTPEHTWMLAEGARFGFSWDEGKRAREPWHFRYVASMDRMKSAPKATGGTVPARLQTTVADLAVTQQQLAALGYDPGPVDGKLGDRAKSAVQAFQTDAGLTPDGIPGPATRKAIDTMATTLEQILTEVRRIRPDIATVHDSVLTTPERTLRATVERAGGRMEGTTSLAGMLAWNDDHTLQILEAIKATGQAAGVSDTQLQQITDAVSRVTAEQVASELTITTRED